MELALLLIQGDEQVNTIWGRGGGICIKISIHTMYVLRYISKYAYYKSKKVYIHILYNYLYIY